MICTFCGHVLTQISFSPLDKQLVVLALPIPLSLQITMGMPIQRNAIRDSFSHENTCEMQSSPHDVFSSRGLDIKTLIKHKAFKSSYHPMTSCFLRNVTSRQYLLSFRNMIIVWSRNLYLVMNILTVCVHSLVSKEQFLLKTYSCSLKAHGSLASEYTLINFK